MRRLLAGIILAVGLVLAAQGSGAALVVALLIALVVGR